MTQHNQPVPPPLPSGNGAGTGPAVPGQPRWATPDPADRVDFAADRNNDGVLDAMPGPAPGPPAVPDPGPLPDDPATLHSTELTRTYPCASCGGMLAFDPDNQAMKCRSCGNIVPVSPPFAQHAVIAKRDLGRTMHELAILQSNASTRVSGDKEIVCQACGGRTVFTGTMTAIRCPYCNTPIQRDDVQDAPTRLPIDGILPLQVSERVAAERIEQWINSRRFAPNAFKKYREVGSFTSIYLPYFAYDAHTTTRYRGMRGIHRTETYRDSQGKTATRIVTDWYPAAGVVNNAFEDVTGHANAGLDEGKITELEPWPMNISRPYSPEFVAGHLSRTYDHDAQDVFETRVRPRMESVIDSTIRADIGGNVQQIHWRDTTWLNLAFSQFALPIWMLTVTFKNRPFNVMINGVTGEVQGRRPWSWVKITFAVLVALLVVAVVVYLVQYYGE